MVPFVPSPEQRKTGIKHIVYEYRNLITAARYSINGDAPWRTNCDDVFLLGCRKLDDFLMKDKRSTKFDRAANVAVELDDILALDYLPNDATRTRLLPIWIAEWRGPMNKQLAHLAYNRDKEWHHQKWVRKLRDETCKALRQFHEGVADEEYVKLLTTN